MAGFVGTVDVNGQIGFRACKTGGVEFVNCARMIQPEVAGLERGMEAFMLHCPVFWAKTGEANRRVRRERSGKISSMLKRSGKYGLVGI